MARTIIKTETEKAVQEVLESRWRLGRERYGEGINHDQSECNMCWLDNAIEEAADLLQYLVAFKLKLQKENESEKAT